MNHPSINARVYREHEQPTVPVCPADAGATYHWRASGDGYTLHNSHGRDCGRLNTGATISTHDLAELYNRAPDLLAENARLRAALTSFIETWDALPDECRRAANGATNFGRLITTLRAALLGKEGA